MKKINIASTSPAMMQGKKQTRKYINYRDTQKVRGRKTYFIQPDDVWARCIKDRGDGEVICFESVMGRIMEQDVGKMMQKVGDFWYVENDEQFRKRVRR